MSITAFKTNLILVYSRHSVSYYIRIDEYCIRTLGQELLYTNFKWYTSEPETKHTQSTNFTYLLLIIIEYILLIL